MKYLSLLFFLTIFQISFSQSDLYKEYSRVELEKTINNSAHRIDNLNRKLDSCRYAQEKTTFCKALANDSVVKIKSPWSFYTFKVLSCKGNREGQNVELIILAEQSHMNQRIQYKFRGSSVIDGLGKALKVTHESSGPDIIFTNIPFQITLTVQGVLPGTEKIGLLGLIMSSKDISISSFEAIYKIVEFRNISIKW